jgi:serine/threonine protein kinase
LTLGFGPPETPERPERIGSYRILDVLGVGGFGIVYLAEQERPLRRVALKVLRTGVADRAARRRFEREADVLGQLRHPGIAQVYEAGTDDSGHSLQSYFAMELVEGAPLTTHADARGLDRPARIRLFLDVCDAVHHAHGRGVLHRDLKPANILVDPDGHPKVLDFGIARVIDPDLRTATLQTSTGQLLGTVPYMSPEQIEGDPESLDGRADVYSLGVVLYELLTGRLPLDVQNQPLHQAARLILEAPPLHPARLDRAFRGDLGTILMKALEKDRERRYATAAALADDLRNVLAMRPILARPPSLVHRVSRLAARYRRELIGVLALVVGSLALWFSLSVRSEVSVDDQIADATRDLRATSGAQPDLGVRTAAIQRLGLLATRELDREHYRAAITQLIVYVRENLAARKREGAPEVTIDRGRFHIEDIRAALQAIQQLSSRSGIRTDFMATDFSDLSLIELDMSGLGFSHCVFDRSFLSSSDWSGVDFTWASLREIAAWNADFSGANFADADLEGAKLASVELDGTNLPQARTREFELCADVSGLEPGEAEQLGCTLAP